MIADYVARYNAVSSEMDELALQSDADRQAADERIMVVEQEFATTLSGVEGALRQIDDLLRIGSSEFLLPLSETHTLQATTSSLPPSSIRLCAKILLPLRISR
jgi:hypothetical protein